MLHISWYKTSSRKVNKKIFAVTTFSKIAALMAVRGTGTFGNQEPRLKMYAFKHWVLKSQVGDQEYPPVFSRDMIWHNLACMVSTICGYSCITDSPHWSAMVGVSVS